MAEKENSLPEDVVEYSLFPVIADETGGYELKTELQECARKYLTCLSPSLINVIWQNERFRLTPVQEQGSTPGHLVGQTNFGDNVEDEWFIVHLLFELTNKFPGLIAKVIDSDEEFLLIEAANALPKWLNPETAENRTPEQIVVKVKGQSGTLFCNYLQEQSDQGIHYCSAPDNVYIYEGEIHIIPKSDLFPGEVNSIGDALEFIRTYSNQTRASQKVQTAIKNRIKNFPEIMQENTHYAHTYIPASMAAIFDERPQLVAAAVRAFYYRDPIDLQCCRTFKYFRPGTRVMHRTRLTRCLYAQLIHQDFQPDKRSGWVRPATSNPKFRSHDLGIKLAHGFEILCHKSADHSEGESNGHQNSVSNTDVRWRQYLKSLTDNNYFRGELEGSILYKQLLDNAWKFYQENLEQNNRVCEAGAEIHQMLKTVQFDIEERRAAESSLPPPDDDSWLNLTPESLDNLLKDRGGGSGNHSNQGENDDVFDLGKVAESMKAFVGKISSADGAEFPGNWSITLLRGNAPIPTNNSIAISFRGPKRSFVEEREEEEEDIQFDGTGFITAMQDMFEFEDSETDSSSDMDEYGWEDDGSKSSSSKPGIKRPPSLDKYMDIMDRELAKTDVGKSFEKQEKPRSRSSLKGKPKTRDIDEEDDDFQPVDVDLNAVKNLLESYGAQEGLAGPTSNILGRMGVNIPTNTDFTEEIVNDTPVDRVKKSNETVNEARDQTANSPKPKPPPRPKPPSRSNSKTTPPPRPPAPARQNSANRSAERPRPRLASKETDV